MHRCKHAYRHKCTLACTYACMHACMHAYLATYLPAYLPTYLHTYIYTHIHTHTYIYIYIHVYICVHIPVGTRSKGGQITCNVSLDNSLACLNTCASRWRLEAMDKPSSWTEPTSCSTATGCLAGGPASWEVPALRLHLAVQRFVFCGVLAASWLCCVAGI